MTGQVADLRIGTCAWLFDEWRGPLYAARRPDEDLLADYSARFRTVEIDSTFYAIPPARTVEGWRRRTPDGFVFAAKAPKVITHEKQLRSCEPELDAFLRVMSGLGEKVGPVLFQFPATFSPDHGGADALEKFLPRLPRAGWDFACEFRHADWRRASFARLLAEHQVAWAWHDASGPPAADAEARRAWPVTASHLYVRLMGDQSTKFRPDGARHHHYDRLQWPRDDALDAWAAALRAAMKDHPLRRVLIYANNHFEGFSPATVARLSERLGLPAPDLEPPRAAVAQMDLFG